MLLIRSRLKFLCKLDKRRSKLQDEIITRKRIEKREFAPKKHSGCLSGCLSPTDAAPGGLKEGLKEEEEEESEGRFEGGCPKMISEDIDG